jgi:hypothetical protein
MDGAKKKAERCDNHFSPADPIVQAPVIPFF